jgi:hypothetical protein
LTTRFRKNTNCYIYGDKIIKASHSNVFNNESHRLGFLKKAQDIITKPFINSICKASKQISGTIKHLKINIDDAIGLVFIFNEYPLDSWNANNVDHETLFYSLCDKYSHHKARNREFSKCVDGVVYVDNKDAFKSCYVIANE